MNVRYNKLMASMKNARITNAKEVTAADILNEANAIWHECNRVWNGHKRIDDVGTSVESRTAIYSKFGVDDQDRMDRLYDMMYKCHPEFGQSYPTVLRHMIQDQNYDSDVFKKYLRKLEKKPWTNDTERMDSYTDYFIMLYMKKHPKYDNRIVKELWADYRKRLQDAHDNFIKQYEKIAKKVEDEAKQNNMERRQDIIKRLKTMVESGDIKPEPRPVQENNEESVSLNNLIDNMVDNDE